MTDIHIPLPFITLGEREAYRAGFVAGKESAEADNAALRAELDRIKASDGWATFTAALREQMNKSL